MRSLGVWKEPAIAEDEALLQSAAVEGRLVCPHARLRNLQLGKSASREAPLPDVLERIRQFDTPNSLTVLERIVIYSPQRRR